MTSASQMDELIFPPESEPYGLSYEKWTIKWWHWLLAIPRTNNPAFDTTGEHCAQNQTDPNVWFLAGTLGGSAKRECHVPEKAILFPIINDEQTLSERPDIKSDFELESVVKRELDGVIGMYVTVDDVPIPDLTRHRVRQRSFDVTLPEDNIWGVKPGPTRAAADGYWIFLKPLSVGEHKIHFSGRGSHFETAVTYDITVERGLP